jgi:hypothetical protein
MVWPQSFGSRWNQKRLLVVGGGADLRVFG